MEQNLINAELPAADAAIIDTAIETIKSKTNFSISLTPEEKSGLVKMGNVFRQPVLISINVLAEHPEIMPGTFDIAQFKKDYNLALALQPISQKLHVLLQAIDDTIMAAESDSVAAMLEVYGEVKTHKDRIPGLSAIYDEMKSFFPRKKAMKQPAPAAQ